MAKAEVKGGTSDDQGHPASWVKPRLAVIVVSLAAVTILVILLLAVWELQVEPGTAATATAPAVPPSADPNAGTIAALASAAFSSLTALVAAYFGVKVASEASAQSAATTATVLRKFGDSTANGSPTLADITGEPDPAVTSPDSPANPPNP